MQFPQQKNKKDQKIIPTDVKMEGKTKKYVKNVQTQWQK
jgi:hypothetical protein